MRQRLVTVIVLLGAALFLVPGVWAFFWPHSFHRNIAAFDPFNLHLFHDLGAFQIGIGVALLGALVWQDAVVVALLGATAGAVVHAVSHVMDRHLGGSPSDPWAVSAIALVLATALTVRIWSNPARD